MKIAAAVLMTILGSHAGLLVAQEQKPAKAPDPQFTLIIPAYSDGAEIPMPYSCTAKPDERGDFHGHVTPALKWSGAPKGTASFAVIFHDVDALGTPKNGYLDSIHWLVWNIPGESSQLAEGLPLVPELPDGSRQGTVVAKITGYQGACRVQAGRAHHYITELFALDQMLDLKGGASAADLEKAMDGHVLGRSAYIGLNSR